MRRGDDAKGAGQGGPEPSDCMNRVHIGKPSSQPPTTTPKEQFERNLEQCLALLQGPLDERRFVGLLLVTKVLPSGDEAAVKRVFHAIGFNFLQRLLLPLRMPAAGDRSSPSSEETLQKQAAMARLGLAVLSGFARVPELAAADEMVELLPLFLKVAREGGVSPILLPGPAAGIAAWSAAGATAVGAQHAQQDPGADAAAVVDALECTLAAVAASGEEGRLVALESGALRASAAVLQRGSLDAGADAGAGAQQQQQEKVVDLEFGVQGWLLAARLVAAVLGEGEGGGATALSEHTEEVLQLVPALANLLALPTSLPPWGSTPTATAAASRNSSGSTTAADLAVLQLEVLHALHLLLTRATAASGNSPLRAALSHSAQQAQRAQQGWPQSIRAGLSLVLRGRVSPVERHAALQLAAAVVDLAAPDWLLDDCVPGSAADGSRSGDASGASGGGEGGRVRGSFFQVLLEVARIETSVLLLDALAPSAPVPLAGWWAPAPAAAQGVIGAAGAAAAATTAAAAAAGEGEEGIQSEAEEGESEGGSAADDAAQLLDAMDLEQLEELSRGLGDSEGGGKQRREQGAGGRAGAGAGAGADVEVLQSVLRSSWQRQRLEQGLRAGGVEAGSGAAAGEAAGPRQGPERVDMVKRVEEVQLPTEIKCQGPSEPAGQRAARLLPACFALLEASVEALALSAERAEEGTPLPHLPDSVALRGLTSIQEVCEALLQFLEQTVGAEDLGKEQVKADDSTAAVQEALAMAAVRMIGRFCSEAPAAFGPRLRHLLPHLLAASPAALRFLLPLLLQQTGPAAVAATVEGEAEQERAAWLEVLKSREVLPNIAHSVMSAAADYQQSKAAAKAVPNAEDLATAGATLAAAATLLSRIVAPGPASGPLDLQDLHSMLPMLGPLLGIAEGLVGQLQLRELRLLSTAVGLCTELAAATLQQANPSRQPLQPTPEATLSCICSVLLCALREATEALRQVASGGVGAWRPAGQGSDLEDLLDELVEALGDLTGPACRLLRCSPFFARACAEDGWVRGLAGQVGLQGLGKEFETAAAAGGLYLFLDAVLH